MATFGQYDERRLNRWYFGGLASACAACVTHPLDLIKVHLQTQQEKKPIGFIIGSIYKTEGILGFYNGISASLIRQLTYTTTRFAIYESAKPYFSNTVWSRLGIAILAGTIGGYMGVPSDVVNVRMQNDVKLPPEKRRNYKHVFDGFYRVCTEEGVASLFSGASMAVTRGVLMTIGQNVVYDQIKMTILNMELLTEGSALHFSSSVIAAGIATLMTQPLDVLKTRVMNAKPGEFKSILHVILYTAQVGPSGFFKGFVPAFVRLGPHTIILFMLMEQFRLHFGYLEKS